jgi:hypothetical protein
MRVMLREPDAHELALLRRIAEVVGLERTRCHGNPMCMAAGLVSVATLLVEACEGDRAALVQLLRDEAERLDAMPAA